MKATEDKNDLGEGGSAVCEAPCVRVLVADDERIERTILCRKLARELDGEIALFQAENGREAIRLFEEHRPQVVVLDISMPGIDGLEVARAIRALDGDCALIFLTAYSDFDYMKKAIRLRALDYLTKPCEDEELFAVLGEAVYQARRRAAEASGQEDGTEPGRSVAAASPESEESCENSGGTAGRKTSGGEAGQGAVEQDGEGQPDPAMSRETPGSLSCRQAQDDGETGVSAQAMQDIRDFVSNNFSCDISMQDAARFMNYSETYFCRLFKQNFGCNFTTYLTRCRIQAAEQLLRTTELPVREVALRAGYADANYFAKVFRRQTGQAPSAYRG